MKKEVFKTHVDTTALKKKSESGKTSYEPSRYLAKVGEKPVDLEDEVDTSKDAPTFDDLDAILDDLRLDTTADPPESSSSKTDQVSQGYIIKVSYPNEIEKDSVETFKKLMEDITFGDTRQATLSDFGDELMIDVINRADDPPTRTLVWINKKDAKKLFEWLRWWFSINP
jgi:hypothetical protein